MLFSYCKRTSDNSLTHVPFNYHVNPLETPQGFGKQPTMCNGLNVPHVYNRGIPKSLFDKETEIRGQGRMFQPYCSNPCENNGIEFSMFKWMKDTPVAKIGQPIPCAPIPVIEVKQYGQPPVYNPIFDGDLCETGCKEHPFQFSRNMTRPQQTGQIGMNVTPSCKI
jgi:hypothetical protein